MVFGFGYRVLFLEYCICTLPDKTKRYKLKSEIYLCCTGQLES